MAALLTLGACAETVVLGTECPERLGSCASDREAGLADAGALGDAGGPDSDLADAGANDAQSSDDDGGALVALENASFELRANSSIPNQLDQFGHDVWVSDVGKAVPVTDRLFANIEPWFACFVGTQAASQVQRDSLFHATDGLGFVSTNGGLSNLVPGLYQRLAAPLQPGRSYSFQIDVLSAKDVAGPVSLEIGARGQPCAGFKSSARSASLSDGSWQTICLTFTPAEALSVLGIVPLNLGFSGGLAFDNLRSVRGCP